MSKILITPKFAGVAPFEIQGKLSRKVVNGEVIYYIAGESFPEEIVTVLEEDDKQNKMMSEVAM